MPLGGRAPSTGRLAEGDLPRRTQAGFFGVSDEIGLDLYTEAMPMLVDLMDLVLCRCPLWETKEREVMRVMPNATG